MILVVGATGFLGRAICRRLVDKGVAVRALVRPSSEPVKVDSLRCLGVRLVFGDLKDRKSLVGACEGIERVITTATATGSRQPDDTIQNTDQAGQLSLIDVATDAGVSRFIYISCFQKFDNNSPLATANCLVEQRLAQSGMHYTILRPNLFMETWLSPTMGFDFLNAKATIYGTGTNKVSWISRGDVASLAVAACESSTDCNPILAVGGPEGLGPLEVVRIFEELMDKPFEIRCISEDRLWQEMARTADSVQQSLIALRLAYARGNVIDMQDVLRSYPLKLLSVAEYARHMVLTMQR